MTAKTLQEQLRDKAETELNTDIQAYIHLITQNALYHGDFATIGSAHTNMNDDAISKLPQTIKDKMNENYITTETPFYRVIGQYEKHLFDRNIDAYEARITGEFMNKVDEIENYFEGE